MNSSRDMAANIENAKKVLSSTFSKHTNNIALWGGFLTASLLVYFLLSSGDFSFLLTYASFMRCFGFCLLNYKIWTGKTVSGLSIKTQQLYAVVFVARLLSILRHQGYLPFDKTGDWFYHAVEIISLGAICAAIYAIVQRFRSSYDEKFDRFGNLHIPNELGALYLLGPCVLLAIIFHPSLNHEFLSDTCWTISMYLESVAMLPQLYMFQKQASEQGGTVEALTGHFVFALGFSRVFELIFWLISFKELTHHTGSRAAGYLVLLAQLGHLGVMGDFFYYYFRSISIGAPMELPTTYSGVV